MTNDFPGTFLSLLKLRSSCYLFEMSECLSEEYRYSSPLSDIKYVRAGRTGSNTDRPLCAINNSQVINHVFIEVSKKFSARFCLDLLTQAIVILLARQLIFCSSLARLKWNSSDFFTTASEDWRKKRYLIRMHSFRKLPTAIMTITENISESPTVTNGTACQCTILMIILRGNKGWQHVSWQGNQSCIQREQFRAGSSGRVSEFLLDKKRKPHKNVENKLKCNVKTALLSKAVKKIPHKMYLKLAVDVCFPAVITAASCDFDNKNQNQTLLMI